MINNFAYSLEGNAEADTCALAWYNWSEHFKGGLCRSQGHLEIICVTAFKLKIFQGHFEGASYCFRASVFDEVAGRVDFIILAHFDTLFSKSFNFSLLSQFQKFLLALRSGLDIVCITVFGPILGLLKNNNMIGTGS